MRELEHASDSGQGESYEDLQGNHLPTVISLVQSELATLSLNICRLVYLKHQLAPH